MPDAAVLGAASLDAADGGGRGEGSGGGTARGEERTGADAGQLQKVAAGEGRGIFGKIQTFRIWRGI